MSTEPTPPTSQEYRPVPAAVRRVALAAAIAIGWGFIAWHNHFYLTPAVVILALGWGAVVSTVYLLWRLGAAGADPAVVGEDWWLATGAQEDLMREKRALLKTIREIEFDHQIGKLSDEDAEEMMQVVRVKTVEVMKAIDQAAELESSGGVRAEIERELRARIEVEAVRKAARKGKGKSKPAGKATAAPARSETAINARPAVEPELGNGESDAPSDGERADDDGPAAEASVADSASLQPAHAANEVVESPPEVTLPAADAEASKPAGAKASEVSV